MGASLLRASKEAGMLAKFGKSRLFHWTGCPDSTWPSGAGDAQAAAGAFVRLDHLGLSSKLPLKLSPRQILREHLQLTSCWSNL